MPSSQLRGTARVTGYRCRPSDTAQYATTSRPHPGATALRPLRLTQHLILATRGAQAARDPGPRYSHKVIANKTPARPPDAGEERCHQLVRTRARATEVTSRLEHLLEAAHRRAALARPRAPVRPGHRPASRRPRTPLASRSGRPAPIGPRTRTVRRGARRSAGAPSGRRTHPVQVEVGRGARHHTAAGTPRAHGRSFLRARPMASRRHCWGPASARCRGRRRARRPAAARWARPRGPGRSGRWAARPAWRPSTPPTVPRSAA